MPDPVGASLDPTASAMIARANHFRAEASLPPLLGDAHLTQASENHSRY
jgi:uncharacterized protein YkwD